MAKPNQLETVGEVKYALEKNVMKGRHHIVKGEKNRT
ncbi:hypothetical protein SAMN05421676_106174 [Salinibacillus kushneri]|uniref:Uncharacterized protein n=1 Tax=Salinibacillus kushneri TaxID=237682 RepID=A0A1I0G3G3_9BACI|nr:hypothetical protein SAMN05421676_106174 [Salinibacillus kushneri]